jgi:hypothetical protein
MDSYLIISCLQIHKVYYLKILSWRCGVHALLLKRCQIAGRQNRPPSSPLFEVSAALFKPSFFYYVYHFIYCGLLVALEPASQ